MAVETKYYCDNCKAEIDSRYKLFLVKMAIHKGNDLISTESMEICESCAWEVGYKTELGEDNISFISRIKKLFFKG